VASRNDPVTAGRAGVSATYACKTPGCGEDLTDEVYRTMRDDVIAMRSRLIRRAKRVDAVVAACSKGHRHRYP
jgi:hypothetical protein